MTVRCMFKFKSNCNRYLHNKYCVVIKKKLVTIVTIFSFHYLLISKYFRCTVEEVGVDSLIRLRTDYVTFDSHARWERTF